MRVALLHYWLVRMRGGERVLEAICGLFPEADIYTHVYEPEAISAAIRRHRVRQTLVGHMPLARRLYRSYLPLMPLALRRLDLSGYDLVISSESGPAKGVRKPPGTPHLCYCHTPMRYVWDLYDEYRGAARLPTRLLMPFLVRRLRRWDVRTAASVDLFIANSRNVRDRIRRAYGRDAEVIHPPVDTSSFASGEASGSTYLAVGELVRYKRFDLAVEAFNRLGRPLVLIGDGPERSRLEKLAGPNVRFLGRVSERSLRAWYGRCRALVFPGVEDFGIVPVEAMASGRPVLAYAEGGALETVVDGVTGLFFPEQTAEALAATVERFEQIQARFDPDRIRRHAALFDRARFEHQFGRAVERLLARSGAKGDP